jgi:hypothetical protein
LYSSAMPYSSVPLDLAIDLKFWLIEATFKQKGNVSL